MGFSPAYVHNPANKMPGPKPLPESATACDGCNGSGIYYGAGRVENGVFVGFKGTCYRCGGKGHQTAKDVKRNRYYDQHVRRLPSA
jgi:hypothetical protein